MGIRGTNFIYYQTNDVEKAIEFCRDMLGMELYDYLEDVQWAEFNAKNATFATIDPSAFGPEAKAQHGGGPVAFSVENLEGFADQL